MADDSRDAIKRVKIVPLTDERPRARRARMVGAADPAR